MVDRTALWFSALGFSFSRIVVSVFGHFEDVFHPLETLVDQTGPAYRFLPLILTSTVDQTTVGITTVSLEVILLYSSGFTRFHDLYCKVVVVGLLFFWWHFVFVRSIVCSTFMVSISISRGLIVIEEPVVLGIGLLLQISGIPLHVQRFGGSDGVPTHPG